jgi:hypothetical protein
MGAGGAAASGSKSAIQDAIAGWSKSKRMFNAWCSAGAMLLAARRMTESAPRRLSVEQ